MPPPTLKDYPPSAAQVLEATQLPRAWLEGLGFGGYCDAALAPFCDPQLLVALTDDALADLHMPCAHRTLLLQHIHGAAAKENRGWGCAIC